MAEPIRYYLDEHIPTAIAHGLRRRGVAVVTTHEAGRRGLSDADQLAYAVQAGLVLVTQDTDFLRLHAAGVQHGGIAYAPQQTSSGALIRWLLLIHEVLTPAEMADHVEFFGSRTDPHAPVPRRNGLPSPGSTGRRVSPTGGSVTRAPPLTPAPGGGSLAPSSRHRLFAHRGTA
jgi:hypothetical protein